MTAIFLKPPMFNKPPKLTRKGSKAAATEAATEVVAATAATEPGNPSRGAIKFDQSTDGLATERSSNPPVTPYASAVRPASDQANRSFTCDAQHITPCV